MSTSDTQVAEQDDQLYCYGHPKEPTRLRCSRCERPICGRCAIPASVGQHCPECVADARRTAPKIRSTMQATAPAVMTIIGIDVFVYLLQILVGREVVQTLALSPSLVSTGEWWRLLTPMLVHGGPLHLFLNMYILFIYGPNVEQAFGTVRFIIMFLIAGFMGSAFSYAFPPDVGSVGASGAIFGVVGVLVVYLFNRRRSQFMAGYLRGMGFFVIANLILGFLPGLNIDNFAHIGGLLGGVLLGLGFDRGRGGEARSPLALQVATAVAVTALGLLLVLS
ncbi:MAG: rhomboid family intramembrane serine protease [Actinomycetota bacterium]|nr:rhomboid family intramembrane serine protease [Actinomycetota bacterium]